MHAMPTILRQLTANWHNEQSLKLTKIEILAYSD